MKNQKFTSTQKITTANGSATMVLSFPTAEARDRYKTPNEEDTELMTSFIDANNRMMAMKKERSKNI